MKWKKILGTGLLALAVAFTLAATGTSQAATKQVYRRMEKDTIQTMDPSLIIDAISGQANVDTMDGFYRWNGKTMQPALATKIVEPTNGGKTYTIPLRQDAKWSNGDPVTAYDFVYGWQRTVNPKTASQYAYLYAPVENANDINSGKKPVNTLGIKALDKYTVQITLSQPVPYMNDLLAFQCFYPQDQKFVEKQGKKFGTTAKTSLSNGPFILKGWNGTNNTWTEVKNPTYWNAKNVKMQKIEVQVVKDPSTALNLYQDKKLDDAILTGENAQQMRKNKDFVGRKQSRTQYIEFNQKKDKYFQNAKIRQAFSLAVNRTELVNKVLGDGSIVANNVTAQGLMDDPATGKDFAVEATSKDKSSTAYNTKQAKTLLAQGLKEVGKKKLNVAILSDDTDSAKKIAEYLQSTWEQNLGKGKVNVTLTSVPFKTRLTRSQSGQFDIVLSGWQADYPDPISFLSLFTSDSDYNFGKWNNSQYDQYIKASQTTDALDKQKRWDDMMNAQLLLTKQQGVVPLFQVVEAHLVTSKAKNLLYSPANTYNFATMYMK